LWNILLRGIEKKINRDKPIGQGRTSGGRFSRGGRIQKIRRWGGGKRIKKKNDKRTGGSKGGGCAMGGIVLKRTYTESKVLRRKGVTKMLGGALSGRVGQKKKNSGGREVWSTKSVRGGWVKKCQTPGRRTGP